MSDLAATEPVGGARVRGVMHRLRTGMASNGGLVAGVAYLVVLAATAATWPLFYDQTPRAQNLRSILEGPSSLHVLGTDEIGRDFAARMLEGASVSLSAIALAVGVSCLVGLVPGLMAGYFGGWLDTILMRATDILISFPGIVLALVIIAMLGPSLTNAMLAVGLSQSPQLIRVVRSSVLRMRGEAFMEASDVMGATHPWKIRKHVVPNVTTTVVVMINLMAAQALIIEAGLSFIGLGVQPPTASWGGLLKSSVPHISQHPRLFLAPGAMITATVLALNVVGDGLRRRFLR